MDSHASPTQGMAAALTTCPNCTASVRFSFIYGLRGTTYAGRPARIQMFPAPKFHFDIGDLPESVPERLKRSFEDTVRALNAQIYGATATSGRRTLEGIFKYLVSEDKRKQPLYKLVQVALDQYDFSEPVARLSHAIRSGGNLGAHFDDDEPDSDMAIAIVQLLHYLIEYIYVLPEQIKDLEDKISSIPSKSDSAIVEDS